RPHGPTATPARAPAIDTGSRVSQHKGLLVAVNPLFSGLRRSVDGRLTVAVAAGSSNALICRPERSISHAEADPDHVPGDPCGGRREGVALRPIDPKSRTPPSSDSWPDQDHPAIDRTGIWGAPEADPKLASPRRRRDHSP